MNSYQVLDNGHIDMKMTFKVKQIGNIKEVLASHSYQTRTKRFYI